MPDPDDHKRTVRDSFTVQAEAYATNPSVTDGERLEGLVDLAASEHPTRATVQNRVERLRDPSHVRALPISDLVDTVADPGIEVTDVRTDPLVQKVDTWLDNAGTADRRAERVREMVRRDVADDRSGLRPFGRDGDLHIVHRTVAIAGRRLDETSAPSGSTVA